MKQAKNVVFKLNLTPSHLTCDDPDINLMFLKVSCFRVCLFDLKVLHRNCTFEVDLGKKPVLTSMEGPVQQRGNDFH